MSADPIPAPGSATPFADLRTGCVRAGGRDLGPDDLAYLNRMTTAGLVLPNVAHELNNALQVVSGLCEMLGFRTDLPADAQDKIGRIGAQCARATQMMRELVAYVRREDAGITLVDVVKVVEDALAFRRYHLARAKISVVVTGVSRGVALARADGSNLRQVLLNLVINAEQSLAGRKDARLQIDIERDGDRITVRIADNGTGLPDGPERLVEPFFTTRTVAAGLGLTVADALARGLGGSLSLDSVPDSGTVAVVTLRAETAVDGPVASARS